MCIRQSPAKFSHAVMFFKPHGKLDVVSIWLYIGDVVCFSSDLTEVYVRGGHPKPWI